MKRSYIIFAILLVPIIVFDVLIFTAGKLQPVTLATMLVTFVAVILLFWFFQIRGQKTQTDERTIRLARAAIMYSYFATLYVVVLLMACDTLGWLKLTGVQALTIVIMVMTFTSLIFQAVMTRRGDAT